MDGLARELAADASGLDEFQIPSCLLQEAVETVLFLISSVLLSTKFIT